MAITTTIYNTIFKRSSTFALTIFAGSFMMEAGITGLAETIFGTINRGKLWEHIKDNYAPKED